MLRSPLGLILSQPQSGEFQEIFQKLDFFVDFSRKNQKDLSLIRVLPSQGPASIEVPLSHSDTCVVADDEIRDG